MVRLGILTLVLSAAAIVGGCAGSQGEQPPSLLTDAELNDTASPPAYQLSKKELKYNCKKLTGIMQVRILQIRDYDPNDNATLAARGVQSVTTPIMGGTTAGTDPDGQYRKDLAMLQAYNHRLAEKGCKTYDLAAELKRRGPRDMPAPTKPKTQP